MCADAWFHGSSRPAGDDAVACSMGAFFACSAPSEVASIAEVLGESGKEMNCSSSVPEIGVTLTLSGSTGSCDVGFGSAVALACRGVACQRSRL